jgi:hypothetical protein
MDDSFQRGIRIHAVIYVHDISRDAITSTMRLDLDILVRMCGPVVMKAGMITIVTTRRGEMSIEAEKEREEIVRRDLWSPRGLGRPGLPSLERVNSKATALRVINLHLDQIRDRPARPPLSIQYELVYLRRDPLATRAGTHVSPVPQSKSKGAPERHLQDPILEHCVKDDIVFVYVASQY